MIGTQNIKDAQHDGVFTLESNGPPKEVLLIIGSCRAIPYVNYLKRYNDMNGAPLRVFFIDPVNFHWRRDGSTQQYEQAILARENHEPTLQSFRSATIYIHEHFQQYGMFNSLREAPKNIYQFGLNPRITAQLPSWHDVFCMFTELIQFDGECAKRAIQDNGNLSPSTIEYIRNMALTQMEKFYKSCRFSDFPEMEEYFKVEFKKVRFWHTGNHIAATFSLYLMRRLNERFLHLDLNDEFWSEAAKEDPYAVPNCPMTQYDKDCLGLEWPEPVMPLEIRREGWTGPRA